MHEEDLREIAAAFLLEASGELDKALTLLQERQPDLDDRMERFIREEAEAKKRSQ